MKSSKQIKVLEKEWSSKNHKRTLHYSLVFSIPMTGISRIFPFHFLLRVDSSKQKVSVQKNDSLFNPALFPLQFHFRYTYFYFLVLKTIRLEPTTPIYLLHSFGQPTI